MACQAPIHAPFRALLGFLLYLCVLPATAHEIRPVVADIHFQEDGRYRMVLQVNMEAVLAGVGPTHRDTSESPNAESYNRLRA